MRPPKPSPGVVLLDQLFQERGFTPGTYALFFVTGEGRLLPGVGGTAERVEEASGYLLDGTGRVFFFWLGWDPKRQAPALTDWEEETPNPAWLDAEEYRRARRELGLTAA